MRFPVRGIAITVLLLGSGLLPGAAGCQVVVPSADLHARLQGVMDAFRAGGAFPGASAAVSLPDGTVIHLTVGEADTVQHIPMDRSHRMLHGSVGKTYFAALAMQLIGEGRLDLDARVSSYLGHHPWYARIPNAAGITVKHLMTHTSGVMRYEFKETFTTDLSAQPDKHWQPEELLAYVLGEEATFIQGEGWEYSDTNFIILGMIMEEITDEVILPDGRFVINPQFEWAGGGFASTTEDLARWARALYTGKAFDPALLPLMLDGVPARLGPGSRYGLGVILTGTPAGPSQGHSGVFPGCLSEMAYCPELDGAVALQVNTSVGRALGRSPVSVLVELASVAGG